MKVFVVAYARIVGMRITDVEACIAGEFGYFTAKNSADEFCKQQSIKDDIDYYPLELSKNPLNVNKPIQFGALCHECADKIIQPNLFDESVAHIVGCKHLSNEEFEDRDKKCPLLCIRK